jgi:hypothetical protein
MQRIFQERREQKRQVKKHVLFNSRPLTAAMVDRLTHKSILVDMNGESY